MSQSSKSSILLLLLLSLLLSLPLFFASCDRQQSHPANAPVITEIQTPVASASQTPYLFAGANDSLYLSWLRQTDSTTWALEYAAFGRGVWSPVHSVMARSDLFVNWADFPSLVVNSNGQKAFHWLQKSGPDTYAYDVRFFREGMPASLVPHDDSTQTEHGFVSMLPGNDGHFLLHWLDGRNYATGQKEMTLRSARVSATGEILDEAIVDERVCECCQTDAALIPGGQVLVYRNRSPEEVRDIYIARKIGDIWSEPQAVFDDHWEIAGCPVNGPAVAADDNRLAVAWFTRARDVPLVQLALSSDGGATFAAPIRVDAGNPLGRVDIAMTSGDKIWVSWLEMTERGVEIQLQRFSAETREAEVFTIAATSADRRSGFPRMAASNEKLFLAWTDIRGEASQVRMVVIR